MADLILVAVIFAVIGAAVVYIVKAKKSGVRCIGCPAGGTCAQGHHEASGCGGCGGGCAGNCAGCHADTK